MFEVLEEDGAARVGRLVTRSGCVPTPFFMPVITRGSGEGRIGPPDYHGLGAHAAQCEAADSPAAISNSLIAAFLPGVDPVARSGGLREWLDTRAVLFTDSGGYQTSQGSSFVVDRHERGCTFRARWSDDRIDLTPQSSIDLQHALRSDVAMVLDDMPPYGSSPGDLAASVERSHRWAREAVAHRSDASQLLFAICQGGTDAALRRHSAAFVNGLDVDGVAIGGIGILRRGEERLAVVAHAVQALRGARPRYVMGVGHPPEIVEMVGCGIDCFDAAYPSIQARRGLLVTRDGLRDFTGSGRAQARNDPRIEAGCDCTLCTSPPATALHDLAGLDRHEAERLATTHNLRFFVRLMDDIRQAIALRSYDAFAGAFHARWGNAVELSA